MTVQLAQARNVGVSRCQVVDAEVEFDVVLDACELSRQFQLFDVVAQAVAHLAFNFIGFFDDLVGTAVNIEPFGSGFRADFRDPGNVIGGITDQCQIVHDLFREDIELVLDTVTVEARVVHRFDRVQNRLHLGAQLVRHRWACRLVLRVQVVAKRLAGGIENDGDMLRLFFAQQFLDHRQDTVQCAGGFAAGIAQRG